MTAWPRVACAAALAALLPSCSVAFPLEGYDVGSTASSSGSGGSGGGGGGSGGEGCVGFTRPPATDLVDDFDDGVVGSEWGPGAGCAPQEIDGELVASPPADGLDYCFNRSSQAYHLLCSEIAFRVVQATTPVVGVQTLVYLSPNDGSPRLALLLEGGGWTLGNLDTGISIDVPGEYDPVQDLWWRLRHDGQILHFETSPDGMAWNERGSGPSPSLLDAVHVQLGAGTHLSLPDPGEARFDCYNVPAPCP